MQFNILFFRSSFLLNNILFLYHIWFRLLVEVSIQLVAKRSNVSSFSTMVTHPPTISPLVFRPLMNKSSWSLMNRRFGIKSELWNWVGFRMSSLMLQHYLSSAGINDIFSWCELGFRVLLVLIQTWVVVSNRPKLSTWHIIQNFFKQVCSWVQLTYSFP